MTPTQSGSLTEILITFAKGMILNEKLFLMGENSANTLKIDNKVSKDQAYKSLQALIDEAWTEGYDAGLTHPNPKKEEA